MVITLLLVSCIFLGGKAYAIEILMGNEGMLVFEPCEVTVNVGDTVTFKNNELPPHNMMVADHPEYSHSDLAFALAKVLMLPLIKQGTISSSAILMQVQVW